MFEKFKHLILQDNCKMSDEQLLEFALIKISEASKSENFTIYKSQRYIRIKTEYPRRICDLVEQVYNDFGNWKKVSCTSDHDGLCLVLYSE